MDPSIKRTKRHNVTVITVGSRNYSLCSISSSLSHATLEQPFQTLTNKVRGKILLKKSSCVFLSCVRLCHCVVIIVSLWIILHIYVHICRCESAYNKSTYIQFCVHWHGGQCQRRLVPNYAVVFRLGWAYLPVSLRHRRRRHLHTRGNLSETGRQIHLPRKQCLINRKRHQQAANEGMDSYR